MHSLKELRSWECSPGQSYNTHWQKTHMKCITHQCISKPQNGEKEKSSPKADVSFHNWNFYLLLQHINRFTLLLHDLQHPYWLYEHLHLGKASMINWPLFMWGSHCSLNCGRRDSVAKIIVRKSQGHGWYTSEHCDSKNTIGHLLVLYWFVIVSVTFELCKIFYFHTYYITCMVNLDTQNYSI